MHILPLSAFLFALLILGCAHIPEQGPFVAPSQLAGLRWLTSVQNNDGSWGEESRSKPVLTSFCILAFLQHGETPASSEFGPCIESGMKRLLLFAETAGPTNRMENEYISTDAILAWALAESFSMTQIPVIAGATEKAVHRLTHSDNNVSPWVINALRSSHLAGTTRDLSTEQYRERMEQAVAKKISGDMLSYGRALHDRLLTYRTASQREDIAELADILAGGMTATWNEHNQDYPVLMHYLASQVFWHCGGDPWKQWNSVSFVSALKQQQIENGLGHWNVPVSQDGRGGKERDLWKGSDSAIYATSMILLSFPPSRHLPSFRSNQLNDTIHDDRPADDDIKIEITI